MFRLQGSKVLAVDMTGDAVKAKNGSMVAYDGQMAFKKMSGGGEGIRGMVTRRLTGEQMTMMEVKGHGTCWFADRACEINLVNLQGDKLYVESSNLLATDAGLRTGTSFTGLRGASQGNGLFTTTVEGHGQAAIMSDGPAVVLRVSSQYPLTVDPGAYIAHQGNLRQSLPVRCDVPHVHGRGRRRGLPDPLRGRRAGVRAAQRAQHDRGGCLTCRSVRSTRR